MKANSMIAVLCIAGAGLVSGPVFAQAKAKAEKSEKPASVATLPPIGEAQAQPGVIDPFVEREAVIKKYRDHMTIALYPSAGGRSDIYYIMRNYLPLANYLSHKVGAVVSLVPEKSTAHYRKKMSKQEYSLVYVHAPLAVSAIEAGYIPVVKHSETLVSSFVARTDGKFKKIDDLSGAKIGWVGFAQTTLQAKAELIKRGLAGKVTAVDAGTAGQGSLAPSLMSGNIDVAVVRKTVAERMVKESGGKLQIIYDGFEGPGFSLFAKKDAYNEAQLAKISGAFAAIRPDGGAAEKDVIEGIFRGSGLRGVYQPAKLADYEAFREAAKIVNESWPGLTYSPKKDAPKGEEKGGAKPGENAKGAPEKKANAGSSADQKNLG